MLDEKFRKFDNESLSGVFFLFVLDGPIDVFRFERQYVDSNPQGMGDGIADGSGCRRETRLTQAFGPIRAFGLWTLDDDRNHLGHVQRRDKVVSRKDGLRTLPVLSTT